MQTQSETSLQFDNKVQMFLDHLFKNKLTGKGFAIRLLTLLALSFAISGAVSFVMNANLTNFMNNNYSTLNPFISLSYLISSLLRIFAVISFCVMTSLSIRRVSDIVPDAAIWPYVIGVVLLGLIPIISYLTYFLLAVLPSDYLTQEKRNQIFRKFT